MFMNSSDSFKSTWEPESNLNKESVNYFNKILETKSDKPNKDKKQISRDPTSVNNCCKSELSQEENLKSSITEEILKVGDECPDEPIKIIKSTDFAGPLVYLVEFKDHHKIMHASVAKEKYPQLVIEFYESKIKFAD